MVTKLEYFGTELNSAGHFRWTLEGERMSDRSLNFKDIPFDPESLIESNTIKGTIKYFRFDSYAVIVIAGSCIDTRYGTKSVFWTNEEGVKLGDLKNIILSIPAAKKIIDKMPFTVNW